MSNAPETRPATGPLEAVAFSGANSRAYLSAVFAAYRAGEVVLAIPAAQSMRSVPGVTITRRESFEDDTGWFSEALEPIVSDAPAQIAFSSGTTGRPKALLLPHRALSDVVTRINAAMGVDASIREYVGVPVTFSFGFGRVRAIAAAGGQAYLPRHGFDPSEIAKMLVAGEINAISAVPTLWRLVLANPEVIGDAGELVKWIEIGSQYMAGYEKAALRALFPNARIVQHYGLTEASRTTLLDITDTPEDRLDSIGRASGDVEISLTSEGVIRTRGPHVALGQVSGAGVKPLTDADGWLTTADRGRIEDGWVYYDGRTDELINSGGLKIDPTRFEQQLVAALGVTEGVAVGREADALRGDKVLVAVKQGVGLDLAKVEAAALEVAEAFGLQGNGALSLREVEDIPLTATGKVRRAELADLPSASAPVAPVADPVPAPSSGGAAAAKAAELQALWAEILGADTVALDQSFYDLGGDSLSALTAIMRMESMGLDADTARGIFDGKTIAEITGVDAETGTNPEEIGLNAPELASTGTGADPVASAKAAELQALWAEILGADAVALDQSFYDLGGDSLSALTAIMRMESMGLDADTARGIFDGKTIVEITGVDATGPAVVASAPAPQQSDTVEVPAKAAELQALWAEILGAETVALDQSFYDLGGDSLSALTAIMRMESMGLDAETARGIFDGKTIAEITGTDLSETAKSAEIETVSPQTTAPVASGKAAELQALWADVLGAETVALDQSFYDLGGDSLSALTAIMRMEAMGLDADTARGIFDGKTIADLVGIEAPATPAPVAQTDTTPAPAPAAEGPGRALTGGLTMAEMMNAVHSVRGVLILWVVFVHWAPGVLLRLGDGAIVIYETLLPALRYGTPGFAMVFGLGIGALGIHHFRQNRELFLKGMRFNTRLIVVGVLIVGLFRLGVHWTEGRFGDRLTWSVMFYSAITYYALAMLAMPLLMRVLNIGPYRLVAIVATGVGAMVVHDVLFALVADTRPPGFLELIKILFTAKYGFFRMTGYVMIGAAIGWLFRQHRDNPDIIQHLFAYGVIMIALGGVMLYRVAPEDLGESFNFPDIWHMTLYAGVTLIILAGFSILNRSTNKERMGNLWHWMNVFAVSSGILALPLFVGHELVIPAKTMLDFAGLPQIVSLTIAMAAFIAAMWIPYVRLMRLLYRPA